MAEMALGAPKCDTLLSHASGWRIGFFFFWINPGKPHPLGSLRSHSGCVSSSGLTPSMRGAGCCFTDSHHMPTSEPALVVPPPEPCSLRVGPKRLPPGWSPGKIWEPTVQKSFQWNPTFGLHRVKERDIGSVYCSLLTDLDLF